MGTAAGVYARISSDPDETRLGVGRQEKDCRELAQRKGWDVVDTFVDNDLSAATSKRRPEYQRLLSAIETGEIDAVIVWDLDRLHRRPIELEEFFAACDAAGLRHLATVGGDVDLSTGEGVLVARIKGAVAAEEVRKLKARVTRKHAELASAGKLSGGGHRPFGYEADRMTLRPGEAEEIRDAARRVLAGESVRGITQDWRRRGVSTVRGAVWSPTTIKRLLCSGRISGQREHHGEIVGEAVWPAIITAAETTRLRAMLMNGGRSPGGTARSYLLSGLVYCGDCGRRMSTRPTAKGRHRYLCVRDRGGCGHRGIDAAGTEDLVVEAVMIRLDTPALSAAVAKSTQQQDDDGGELVELEGRLDQLAEMFASGEIGRREWLKARGSLEDRLQTARARLARQSRTEALTGMEGGVLREAWGEMTFDRRRAVIAAVIERVTVGPAVKGRNRFDPDRVDVVWRA
jgi:site-specific DNA recombinase